jgi:prepilin-type N-terminal cleavage/methylation domain-containing protein
MWTGSICGRGKEGRQEDMRRWMSRARRDEGFTLPEMMIAVLVLSIIVFATFQLLNVHLKGSSVVVAKADMAEGLRTTLDTMVDQMRTAQAFTDAGTSSATFTSYVLGTEQLYYVRFRLEPTDEVGIYEVMYYQETTPPPVENAPETMIAQDVTGLILTYYDSTGTVLPSPNDSLEAITMVEIELNMHKSGENIGLDESATTTVRMRK